MKMNRRRFILAGAVAGGGVLIGYSATRPTRHRRANAELVQGTERFVTSFIKIDPSNEVTIYVPHSEMGQGIHTALSMMAADELDADWEDINIEQAPAIDLFANGDLVKGFAGEFGVPNFLMGLVNVSAFAVAELMNLQTTGGSTSVRYTGDTAMRTAGAAAREMLITAAANRWNVPTTELTTELSHVHHNASGRSFSYGELAADAALLEPPEDPVLKDRSQFNIMGKAISRNDIPAKVDGSAMYGLDAHSEDMLYAAIKLAPVFGTRLVSVDASEALAQRGVERVVELEDSVAVVADNYWRAKKALELVNATFEESDNENISSADIAARFDRALAESNGSTDKEVGDAEAALENAADVIEANYRVPYLAHAAMEPMNCTVHIQGDRADMWTSTQDALSMRGRVASIAGLAEENVTFHQTYCGGGYGRRLPFNWNMIDHATLIAKEFDVPVKTVFSREDDMQQDYYRPAVHNNFKAAFDANNNVTAWHSRFTGPIQVPGASHIPYGIEHQSIRVVDGDTHVPIAAWRSVDHSQQTFFTESFMDEVAHRAGVNPYQMRMDLLQEHPRHRKVLEVAAEAAGYGQNLPAGHALGIAVQESFGSFVAEVAEVSMDADNQPIVHKVTCAIDCGWAVNPDTVEAQIESGIIFGLSAALYGEITLENGRVAQGNFPDYEMVRMATSPEIEVHIVESGEALGGLGEPATPPIAAAVTNAIYILTGQRVRELPIKNHDFSRSNPVAQV
ncbi:MAG: molybdopterin-dependent oxidoreductase [Pseudomonadales bacterium]|nr:molybdopterin-dependent oxidoreductase [Pseudomonadales bacterium]